MSWASTIPEHVRAGIYGDRIGAVGHLVGGDGGSACALGRIGRLFGLFPGNRHRLPLRCRLNFRRSRRARTRKAPPTGRRRGFSSTWRGFLSIASPARAVRWAGGCECNGHAPSVGEGACPLHGTRPAPPCAASLQLGDGVVHVRDVDVVDRGVLSQTLEQARHFEASGHELCSPAVGVGLVCHVVVRVVARDHHERREHTAFL